MPVADEDARAFMLPADTDPESQRRSDSPAWARRSSSYARRSGSYNRSGQSTFGDRPRSWSAQVLQNAEKIQRRGLKQWNKLTPLQKVLASVAGVIAVVLGILFLVYNESIFRWMKPYAKKWNDITAGWLILWFLIIIVSFPPMIGYSTLLTISGFVYGFPNGWYIAASATVVGSTIAFIASRSVLKKYVDRFVAHDKRFNALALTLKHDGLKLLVMIRLCPLPYSISNGAIATFPTVHWAFFALATACVTPKLLIHVYVGSQLSRIADEGEEMDGKTKAISYLSILIGLVAGIATGYFMYKKTQARAKELEAEEREHVRNESVGDLEREYADDPDALEAAVHLREEEDDISLHPAWTEDAQEFRDVDDVANVFNVGDGVSEEDLLSPSPKPRE
ncbi:hypothetical protein EJ05DRAFT_77334 [Pseudovirgaria hyperparasitica]|uniref:Golgi apparatus membrane protein TVP38 n=1 Tax=Pseudovirgaria hyperparasitica TaxID=470096 RepID=A0A6A6W5E1_9PEZI|nr:uncharacterized protein EJ05DRAFT_77334 [Pseudovirgaria hyperparasitica]KAF2756777.1 hypothetical protein EJ05DRAFT_77334 [Pseudovirgaria hyperparasitica]